MYFYTSLFSSGKKKDTLLFLGGLLGLLFAEKLGLCR